MSVTDVWRILVAGGVGPHALGRAVRLLEGVYIGSNSYAYK